MGDQQISGDQLSYAEIGQGENINTASDEISSQFSRNLTNAGTNSANGDNRNYNINTSSANDPSTPLSSKPRALINLNASSRSSSVTGSVSGQQSRQDGKPALKMNSSQSNSLKKVVSTLFEGSTKAAGNKGIAPHITPVQLKADAKEFVPRNIPPPKEGK